MSIHAAGNLFSILAGFNFFFAVALIHVRFKKGQRSLLYLYVGFFLLSLFFLSIGYMTHRGSGEWPAWTTGPAKVGILPVIFLFFKKLHTQNRFLQWADTWHFLPLFFVIAFSVFIVNGHRSDIFHLTGFPAPFEIRWEENVSLRLLALASGILCFVQSIIYFHKVRWTVKRFMKFRKEYQPAINIRKFSWLKNASIFIGLLGLGLSVTIVEVSKFPFISVFLFIFMLAISSFVFLFTLHFYNLFPFEKNSTQEILAEEELIDSKRKNWLNSFTCGELYLDRNLDLEKAARLLEMPKYKLAQLIKEEGHVNFSCFVNYYRVERCKLLLENLPGCKVIDSLVEETGFQARSTFFRVFKKHTGLSPKEYLDQKNCTLIG